MIILSKIRNKLYWYKYKFYIVALKRETLKKIRKSSQKARIYYFLTPTHSNLGDQAQLMCWTKLFGQWYPKHEIIEIPLIIGTDNVFMAIEKYITKKDIIFIHSGYLVCDLYNNWQMLCKVVDKFSQHKITILPQTVHFLDSDIQNIIAYVFNKHSNLHLMCRDKVSYMKAKQIFSNVELSLKPDVVTSLIGTNYICSSNEREGILFCMRNDKEKMYSDEQIFKLQKKLCGIKIETSDTTIKADIWDWSGNRENLIQNFLRNISKYQVMVTDRFHGTIFSQITNTPVIVLSSSDHKLQSGVEWFPQDIFSENIMYAKDLQEAYQMLLNILNRKGKTIKNPHYFLDSFYSKPI